MAAWMHSCVYTSSMRPLSDQSSSARFQHGVAASAARAPNERNAARATSAAAAKMASVRVWGTRVERDIDDSLPERGDSNLNAV